MKYLSITVAAAALLLAPTTANAQLFGGFDNSTVLGGLAGAGLGGAIGSNLAGSGNRDEGTAIGAALGGLAGAAYGNRNSNFYGNPYAGSFNPGFSGRSLLGTAVGAGLGGAIGSNLAGSGVRQEGTAIGAVLGGLAGNALTSRTRYGSSGFGNAGFGNAGFGGAGFGAPRFGTPAPIGFNGAPAFGGGFAAPSYGPSFPPVGLPPVGLPPLPAGGTSFVPGGFVNAGTFANVTPAPMPIMSAPRPVYQPLSTAFSGVTVAAPNLSLAGPAPHNHSTRYGDSIGSTVTQNYVGSTGVYQPKPLVLRSAPTPKSQLVVIERDHYTPSVSSVSAPSHSHAGHHAHHASHTQESGFVAPLRKSSQGGGIYADTVNINYGNNSQVGTTSSNNGSTVGGAGHSHGYSAPMASYSAPMTGYTAPTAPIDIGDGIGDGTWGNGMPVSAAVNTGSFSVGSTSVMGGYSAPSQAISSRYADSSFSTVPVAPIAAPSPSAGAGGSYFIGSGQSFQAPTAAEFNANCASGGGACASAATTSYAAPSYVAPIQQAPVQQAPVQQAPSYNWSAPSYSPQTTSHSAGSGSYSFCGDDKVYNDQGALMVSASPYCRN